MLTSIHLTVVTLTPLVYFAYRYSAYDIDKLYVVLQYTSCIEVKHIY